MRLLLITGVTLEYQRRIALEILNDIVIPRNKEYGKNMEANKRRKERIDRQS